jgi:hypothetical protein
LPTPCTKARKEKKGHMDQNGGKQQQQQQQLKLPFFAYDMILYKENTRNLQKKTKK